MEQNTKKLAVCAVLGAAAVALGIALPLPHFKATYGIIALTGIAYGPKYGALTGALCALLGSLIYGGGWFTCWQILAYGLAGAIPGTVLRGKKRYSRFSLALTGFLTVVLAAGPVLDTGTALLLRPERLWPVYAAGLPVNVSLGISTAAFLFFFGDPILDGMNRFAL